MGDQSNSPTPQEMGQTGAAWFWDPKRNTAVAVPNTEVKDLMAKGYKPAVPIRNKDTGSVQMVPADKVATFQKQGHQVDWSKVSPEAAHGFLQSLGSGSFWSNLGDQFVNAVKSVPAMVGAAAPPVATDVFSKNPTIAPGGAGQTAANIQQVRRNLETENKEGRAPAYKAAATVGQAIGVDVPKMEEGAREGDFDKVFGTAVGNAGVATAATLGPRAVMKGSTVVGEALQNKGLELYRDALNEPKSVPIEKVNERAQVGLNEKIPVTEKGINTLWDTVNDYQTQYESTVAKKPGATVDPNEVVKATGDLRKRYASSVNPEEDVKTLDKSVDEYLDKHGKTTGTPPGRQAGFTGGETPGKPGQSAQPYSATEAQAEKSATYRRIGEKYGEETSSARTETQKQLARGIKDQIVAQFPELANLGKKEGALLDLEPVIQKAVRGGQKAPTVGLKDIAVGAAADTLTGGSKTAAATAGIISRVVRSPAFRSRMAIALNSTGEALSMKDAYAKYDAWVDGVDKQLKDKVSSFNKNEKGTFEFPPSDESGKTTNNASGESSASVEAQNRVASEKAQGIKRFKIDTRSGKEIPLIGVDAVDVRPGQYEVIVQRGPKGETLLDKGARANYKPVPAWPENYQKTTLSSKGGGGANYTAEDLAALKKRMGIADTGDTGDFGNVFKK